MSAKFKVLMLFFIVATGFFALYLSRFASNKNPSIILITVDTLRADHLSSYGYERETSPAIDSLARDGILFNEAIVTLPKTTPSLASILSGLYPKTHRLFTLGWKLDDAIQLLPEILQKKGYLTGGVCGQYNCNRKFGFNQGFDYYDDDFIYVEDRSVEIAGGTFHPYSEKRAQYVVEKSIKWIQKVKDKNNPLFLWLHLMDPHAAYDPPENYGEKFSGSTVYSSRSFFGQSVPVNLIHRHAYVPGVTDYDYYLNKYDGEISYMDSTLKTLFDFLKRNNLYDDALILFTSDHGEYMGEQNLKINYFSHGSTLFESEIKVPLIVKLPQNEFANRQVNAHVSLVDIFPAIIHVVGEKDLYYEGTDLFNAIDNTDDATTVRTNFIQIGDIRPKEEGKKLAVRKGRYKLIVQSQYTILELVNLLHQKKKFDYSLFLYDLAHDPLERSDVSAVNSDIVEELSAELFNWLIGSDSDGEKSYRAEGRNDEETVKHLKSLGYLN